MDRKHVYQPSAVLLRTTFLVPNLHCPSCVGYITSLLDTFTPKPRDTTVSILEHSVTVTHEPALSVASIVEALNSSGYEVFDVILDPSSTDTISLARSDDDQLQAAVRRWRPRRPEVHDPTRQKHDEHCQMCAVHTAELDGEHSVVIDSANEKPQYIAVVAIDGMTCSSCVSTVINALQEVPSVSHADVSLVTHSANINFSGGDADAEVKELLEAVEDIGYGAELVEVKPASSPRPISAANEDLWEVTYTIEGMTCSSCVGNISTAVRQLEFVKYVKIDLIQHSGTVVFNGRNNEQNICETIKDTGYDVLQTDIKSLTQYEKHSSTRTASIVINGMHCPECPKRILSALNDLQLHADKSPTLDDPLISVTYTPEAPRFTIRTIMDTISTVDKAFSVSIHRPRTLEERSRQMLAKERQALLIRVALTVVTAIPTLIIGVIYMNLLPESNPGRIYLMKTLHGVSRAEWATLIMATPVYFFATDHFHRRTIKEIYALWRPRSTVPIAKRFYRFGSMNMLISLGTSIAYFSSLAELIVTATSSSKHVGDSAQQAYFDSVVFLTMFLLIGRYAEAHMKAKSGDAVAALGNLRPIEALLVPRKDSEVQRVSVDLIDTGDVVRILHGSSPPCDGVLVDSSANFDESSLTGESRAINKKQGEVLYAGAINKGSALSMRVTGPAGASMLDSIIQVVREGQAKRAPVERVADLLTSYFVPVIILLAIITWLLWLSLGLSGALPSSYMDNSIGGWPFWSLQFAIAVFVIACPCGLGLAAPTALFVGGGMAAKRGILVKGGGEAFQEASSLDCIALDKTGTLTEGAEPKIVEYETFANMSKLEHKEIFGMMKTIEENSDHPLAKAVVAFASAQEHASIELVSVDEIAGKGMKAVIRELEQGSTSKMEILVGNESLMQDYSAQLSQEHHSTLENWKDSGYSVILTAIHSIQPNNNEWTIVGIFAAADALRPESASVVAALQARGIDVWMLSGDNEKTAIAVGKKVGIPSTNVIAGVLPTEKADKIKFLQKSLLKCRGGLLSRLSSQRNRATVAMVGDGINDAPALAAADVGIAVASGSDVAVQSAAFVLVQSDLRAILTLVTLSRAVFTRVIMNFFWAAIYNIIALPIAAGVLYPIVSGGSHVRLDPAWAALAMALSSISVVGSSLLLRTRLPLVGFRDKKLL